MTLIIIGMLVLFLLGLVLLVGGFIVAQLGYGFSVRSYFCFGIVAMIAGCAAFWCAWVLSPFKIVMVS